MMKRQNVVAALRRDVSFIWHAVIAVVFIGFASLAVAAAVTRFRFGASPLEALTHAAADKRCRRP